MTRAKRSFLPVALALSVAAFFYAAICAASVEVYPGPGVDTYKSNLYTVEVFDGANWIPAYVYGFSRLSVTYWHTSTHPSVNSLTFGTPDQVPVQGTKTRGST